MSGKMILDFLAFKNYTHVKLEAFCSTPLRTSFDETAKATGTTIRHADPTPPQARFG